MDGAASRSRRRYAVGIDIGGSGIKGAPVDLDVGDLAAERVRVDTPQPSTPDAVADVVADVVEAAVRAGGELDTDLDADDPAPVGVTFPAVITHGVARSAANVDPAWVDTDVATLLRERIGRPVHVVNDADAAGVAEARYGAARGCDGVVVLTTLGTGIGTAVLVGGVLVPNSELGHLQVEGHDAETRASDAARKRDDLSWEQWAARLQTYYRVLEDLVWPDLIVVGGGVSRKSERFVPLLDLRTRMVPAELLNRAGIVGAAALAAGA